MFSIIKNLFAVLTKGNELTHAGAWKNVQVLGSFVISLFGLAASFGYDFGLTEEQIYGGVGFVLAVFNGYLTIATTKKIGFGKGETSTVIDSVAGLPEPTSYPTMPPTMPSKPSVPPPSRDLRGNVSKEPSSVVSRQRNQPEVAKHSVPSQRSVEGFDPARYGEREDDRSGWNG